MCKINMKKSFAGILALAVVVTGSLHLPAIADAADTKTMENGVVYETVTMGDYWSTTEKKVPLKENYVFGGWYTTSDGGNSFSPIKEAQVTTDGSNKATNTNTYAKFVPAYVLSVKMQIEAEAVTGEEEKTALRVLSAVDSLDYQKVGFDIWLGSRTTAEETSPSSKVYQQLKLSTTDSDESAKKPEVEVGPAADYFSALRIEDITKNSFASRIYARPYWVTMDGTKVEGLAKYVHVEDAFDANKYMSVPINILSGEGVAAGTMTMTYDPTKVTVVDGKIETGKLLKEMEYHVDAAAGTITFLGNAETVGENVKADGLYANVRFQAVNAEGSDLGTPTITEGQFCDWNEKRITTVKAWDVQY